MMNLPHITKGKVGGKREGQWAVVRRRYGRIVILWFTTEEEAQAEYKIAKAALNQNAKDQIMKDMGLVKVRGALGGVYWE